MTRFRDRLCRSCNTGVPFLEGHPDHGAGAGSSMRCRCNARAYSRCSAYLHKLPPRPSAHLFSGSLQLITCFVTRHRSLLSLRLIDRYAPGASEVRAGIVGRFQSASPIDCTTIERIRKRNAFAEIRAGAAHVSKKNTALHHFGSGFVAPVQSSHARLSQLHKDPQTSEKLSEKRK